MESLRAVVQGEFDTSPRLSPRWKTLADAPNPVAHIRTWGRSGGRRRSWLPVCYRTGRHRATQGGKLCTKFARSGSRVQIPPSPLRWLERRLRAPQTCHSSPWGEGSVRGFKSLELLIHERSVEPRSLPVRLPRHEQVPSAGGSISDCERLTGSQNDNLCRHRPAPIGTESGLALQHIGETLELGWYRCCDLPTPRQFYVEDERRRPQASRRALAHQHTDRRVALVSQENLLRFQDLHARIDLLVLPGQVDPEQHDAKLGAGQALPDLVRSQSVGVPYTSPGPEHQELSLTQPRPLHRPARAGTVTGAE